jgi:outer membrane protein OmpA-like peptidoglycan-associated protein
MASQVDNIWQALSPETRAAIDAGEDLGGKKIEVIGYGSATGGKVHNHKLGMARTEAVIDAFKRNGAKGSSFHTRSRGRFDTPVVTDERGREEEDPSWRKVVIRIPNFKKRR